MAKNVLLVEDNVTLALLTAGNLRGDIDDIEVVTAGSYREAVDTAEYCQPFVIIANRGLPDGDGMDLCRALRSRFPFLKSIIIGPEPALPTPAPDIYGILSTPYDAAELSTLVKNALVEAVDRPSDLPPAVNSVECSGYDRHEIRNLLAEVTLGLSAFGATLKDVAGNPDEVAATVDEYLGQLIGAVKEVSRKLPPCPRKSSRPGT